ncbi:histidine phosphatase family protein [Zavarzinella formosa]|uniref:histidine phosphatase family protein n=1 Tax=Zavarzinella formosa TaxID=360055 RepID=UPI0003828D3C|nr:histidine phosphatase family protein [Zavarzinella formosa]
MRHQLIPFFALLFAAIVSGCAPAADSPGPKRILIVRHAEKPPEEAMKFGLNDKGRERAEALHKLFEKSDARTDPFPMPDFLFAASNTKKSHRSTETIAPLAKRFKMPVNVHFDKDDYPLLAKELLHNSKYAGKTILIVWGHGTIPELAQQLGVKDVPKHWKDEVFNRVWQIDFEDGKVVFQDRPQGLLAGDGEK